jgi:hypothetical protein
MVDSPRCLIALSIFTLYSFTNQYYFWILHRPSAAVLGGEINTYRQTILFLRETGTLLGACLLDVIEDYISAMEKDHGRSLTVSFTRQLNRNKLMATSIVVVGLNCLICE